METVPWLVPATIEWLDRYLESTMHAFEWGAGGSTVWYARRVAELFSVEHDEQWYLAVSDKLANCKIENTVLWCVPNTDNFETYANAIMTFIQPFDFISVDGRARVKCIEHAIPHLKSGGVLLLDNSERPEYKPGIDLMNSWEHVDFKDEWQMSVYVKP